MAKNNLIIIILIAVVAVGLGFFGGIQYQKSKAASFRPRQFQVRNGLQASRPVSGEIVSIDNNTFTLKTQDGSSKIVIYSDSTKVNKTSEGVKEDLEVGEQVMVIGSENTEGAVTAQSISLGGNLFPGIRAGQPSGQGN